MKRCLFIPLMALLVGCAADPGDRVAAWRDGSLSNGELDAFIITLPEEQRQVDDEDPKGWWRERVKDAALESILAQSLEREAESPETASELRRALRRAAVEAVLADRFGPPPAIAEEAAQSLWDELGSRFQVAEQRSFVTIFKRFAPDRTKDETVAAIAELRRRVLAGDSFGDLAAGYSDSETRHRRGFAGSFRRDELSAAVADIVFELAVGVPSEVIVTTNGVHLFMVTGISPGREVTLDDVRGQIVAIAQRRHADDSLVVLREELDGAPSIEFYLSDPEALEAALRGDRQQAVLRVADRELVSGEVVELIEADRSADPWRAYQRLGWEEAVFQAVGPSAIDPATRAAIEADGLRLLVRRALDRRVRESVTSAELERYWATNGSRFGADWEFLIRALEVPFDDAPVERMARLEASIEALDEGRSSLEGLASELGGQVVELGWSAAGPLRARLPMVPDDVFSKSAGQHVAPFSTGKHLVVLKIEDRRVLAAKEFATVADEVRAIYLQEEADRLRRRARDEVLAGVEFAIDQDWLAARSVGDG